MVSIGAADRSVLFGIEIGLFWGHYGATSGLTKFLNIPWRQPRCCRGAAIKFELLATRESTQQRRPKRSKWAQEMGTIGNRIRFGGRKSSKLLARPEGFEPPTPRSVVWCSVQLSYGRLENLNFASGRN